MVAVVRQSPDMEANTSIESKSIEEISGIRKLVLVKGNLILDKHPVAVTVRNLADYILYYRILVDLLTSRGNFLKKKGKNLRVL